MLGSTQDRVTRLDVRRETLRPGTNATGDDYRPAGSNQAGGIEALERTFEREVIPRLVVAHRSLAGGVLGVGLPDRRDVVELTGILASCDVETARARIEAKRAMGLSLELLYLHLLIPAARRLSDLWEADLCHYEEIAVGLIHLQQLVREFSRRSPAKARAIRAAAARC